MTDAKRQIEAILFVSDHPVSLSRLEGLLENVDRSQLRQYLAELGAEYESQGRAFALQEIAGGYQLTTRPECAEAIAKLQKSRADHRLSTAALETLAIVAYKQPIGRADIESIRGVQSGPLLRALLDRGLVRVVGREETLGRPVLYGTTERFLEILGLSSIRDLPRPEELK